jgi:hypothetical protein
MASQREDAMAQPEALAFDMYGTLVDPIAISGSWRDISPSRHRA